MQFFVLGVDGPGFGDDDELKEAHWAYMDRWSDALIARGPTRSVDGGHHTGSVHIIDLPNAAAAARFAEDEPFARSGWYSTVEVTPVVGCLDGKMWDRPAPEPGGASALVRAFFETGTDAGEDLAPSVGSHLERAGSSGWIYAGVTSSASGNASGLVVLADASPADARQWVVDLLLAVGVTDSAVVSQPWSRGGRPSNDAEATG